MSGRILVVDDEADVASVLVDVLHREGHEVDTALNGAEALEKIERGRYDAILSDTKMPVLDGSDFYRQLKSRFPELCRRIIFLTGDVLDRAKREFLESTGAPFLMKPFDVPEVRRLVHRAIVRVEQDATK